MWSTYIYLYSYPLCFLIKLIKYMQHSKLAANNHPRSCWRHCPESTACVSVGDSACVTRRRQCCVVFFCYNAPIYSRRKLFYCVFYHRIIMFRMRYIYVIKSDDLAFLFHAHQASAGECWLAVSFPLTLTLSLHLFLTRIDSYINSWT